MIYFVSSSGIKPSRFFVVFSCGKTEGLPVAKKEGTTHPKPTETTPNSTEQKTKKKVQQQTPGVTHQVPFVHFSFGIDEPMEPGCPNLSCFWQATAGLP